MTTENKVLNPNDPKFSTVFEGFMGVVKNGLESIPSDALLPEAAEASIEALEAVYEDNGDYLNREKDLLAVSLTWEALNDLRDALHDNGCGTSGRTVSMAVMVSSLPVMSNNIQKDMMLDSLFGESQEPVMPDGKEG